MDRLAWGFVWITMGVHEKDLHDYCTYFGTLVMFGLSLLCGALYPASSEKRCTIRYHRRSPISLKLITLTSLASSMRLSTTTHYDENAARDAGKDEHVRPPENVVNCSIPHGFAISSVYKRTQRTWTTRTAGMDRRSFKRFPVIIIFFFFFFFFTQRRSTYPI